MKQLSVIITILAILFSLNREQEQPAISSPNYAPIQPEALHKEYIRDSIQPSLPHRQWQIIIQETMLWPTVYGVTYQPAERTILILINVTTPHPRLTIQHELIHAKQMARGELVQQGQQWYWHGEPIDWNTDYSSRPWEVQARTQAEHWLSLHSLP